MSNFEPFKMVSTLKTIKKVQCGSIVVMLALMVILAACKRDTRPPDVLTREQMADLLVEVYVAEGKMLNQPIQRDSGMKLFLPFEQKLLKKKNISDEVLSKSYKYYIDHPVEFEKVFDAVIDTLSVRETRTNTTSAPPSL